jgi:hypothetical protein
VVIFSRKRGILWQNIAFFTSWNFHSQKKKTPLVTLGVNLVVPTPTKVIRLSIMGEKKIKEMDQWFFFFQFSNSSIIIQEGFSIKWWQSKLVRKLVLKMLPNKNQSSNVMKFLFHFWNLEKKSHKWEYFKYLLILQYAKCP